MGSVQCGQVSVSGARRHCQGVAPVLERRRAAADSAATAAAAPVPAMHPDPVGRRSDAAPEAIFAPAADGILGSEGGGGGGAGGRVACRRQPNSRAVGGRAGQDDPAPCREVWAGFPGGKPAPRGTGTRIERRRSAAVDSDVPGPIIEAQLLNGQIGS